MTASVPRHATPADHGLIEGYADFCHRIGVSDRALRDRLRAARAFLEAHPDLQAWVARPLEARLADLRRTNAWPFLSWAICDRQIALDADLVVAKDLGGFGLTAEQCWGKDFAVARQAARRLGWSANWTNAVVRETLPLVLAWTGKAMGELAPADLDRFGAAVTSSPHATRWARRGYRSHLHSVRVLLYECGVFDEPPRRAYAAASLAERLEPVAAPEIRRAMLRYVETRSSVLARATVESLAGDLLTFGSYLTEHHPEVSSLRELQRVHVESFLAWNRTRHWRGRVARPQVVSASVAHQAVLSVRNFLDDMALWGWSERPPRTVLFASDVPRLPRPLPRALAPDVDAALMAEVARLEDPFARCAITLLRRAGLRLGECLDLELGCVVDYGAAGTWLKVPLGKLGTERSVPLDPAAVALLDDWVSERGGERARPHPRTGHPTDFLFIERGHRLRGWRIRQGLATAGDRAGLNGPDGHPLKVTPHQLRHTYATELANAGMSLQALMALLGHVTAEMTLRYAALASPTLRAAYDTAMGKVRRTLPLVPAGRPQVPAKVDWLSSEFLKTRVATGYCSRHLSAGGCPYANVCETCENFVPAPEFAPAIRNQLADVHALREDARGRGWDKEVERQGRVAEALERHLEGLEKLASSTERT